MGDFWSSTESCIDPYLCITMEVVVYLDSSSQSFGVNNKIHNEKKFLVMTFELKTILLMEKQQEEATKKPCAVFS